MTVSPEMLKADMAYDMTKREAFAMAALQGILANPQYDPPRRRKLGVMAEDAVNAADELIGALEALKETP